MSSFVIRYCRQFSLASLICMVLSASAQAQPIVMRFDGLTRTAAIANVPIFINQPFSGMISYDDQAELVEQSGSTTTYNDPGGAIEIEANGIAFRSVGGLTLTVTRISTPFFSLSRFSLSSDVVATEGTAEPIINLTVGFTNANDFLPPEGIPTDIDPNVVLGSMQITSPDIAPVGGIEPPRTGFIAGSFQNQSLAQPCIADDVRMDWLFGMAAGIRQLPGNVFVGDSDEQRALARHQLALLADQAGMSLADCDVDWTRMKLVQLADSLTGQPEPSLLAEDLAAGLIDQIFVLLLSLE